jgi:PepSY-associated TM region
MRIQVRKWVILTHRYLGIPLSFLFFMWFASGIAMIFTRGMPGLTPDLRLQRLPPLNFDAVKLSPSQASEKAQFDGTPSRATLLMIMGRPAYRFSSRVSVTVFADTGDVLEQVGELEAIRIAGAFMDLPQSRLQYAGELTEPDQWTFEDTRGLPMHKVVADDNPHTHLYISEETAEVQLLTTRGTRVAAWFAAIPHWMYFSWLRSNGAVWRQVVLWVSGIGIVLACLGVVLAFTQYTTRYAGLMRWHYVTGVVFGVFSLTWVFSGLLSMEPFFWASGGGTGDRIPQTLRGGALDLAAFDKWPAAPAGLKELDFLRIQGEPYYLAHTPDSPPELISAHSLEVRKEPFPIGSLLARVAQGNPGVPVAEATVLSDYDSYYHATERKPPLPVLRVKFGDPDATWLYIDPRMSQVVGRFTRRERLQRWIYHGLHSLDFNFWYYQGWVWTAAMVALNAGGTLLSAIGVIIGIKRMFRGLF